MSTEKSSKKQMKTSKKIMIGIVVVATIAFAICLIVDVYNRKQIKKLEALEDTRLFSYEAEIDNVRNIAKLYKIYDQESYDDARKSIKMSAEMSKLLFPTEEYVGGIGYEPEVDIVDIQYVYAPDSDVQTFVVWLNKIDGENTREYDIVCKYSQGYLIDLQGY